MIFYSWKLVLSSIQNDHVLPLSHYFIETLPKKKNQKKAIIIILIPQAQCTHSSSTSTWGADSTYPRKDNVLPSSLFTLFSSLQLKKEKKPSLCFPSPLTLSHPSKLWEGGFDKRHQNSRFKLSSGINSTDSNASSSLSSSSNSETA